MKHKPVVDDPVTTSETDSVSVAPTTSIPQTIPTTGWGLEGCLPGQSSLSRFVMRAFPFLIGREAGCDLQTASRNVSKRHALLYHTPTTVIVKDLDSTNGTFVNGRRISVPTPVGEHDLIQLADVELRLIRDQVHAAEFTRVADQPEQSWTISRMHEVLNEGRLYILFQPIVKGASQQPYGYEALVRTDVAGLESPLALFDAAARLGLEERLSSVCRSEAVRVLGESGLPGALFLNTHPSEYLGEELVASMKELRERAGHRSLVLEVHEQAVPELKAFRAFADALKALDIGLAFDDFGAGQSRLLELSQVTPDFVKFDRSLVKDLGPGCPHLNLVQSLHQNAKAIGITTLAEGLETPESVSTCIEMGFDLFQGYAFGRPSRVNQLGAVVTK